MTVELAVRQAISRPEVGAWRRARFRERFRSNQQDLRSAQLAWLHQIRSVVENAQAVIGVGWTQQAWFAYRDDSGREQRGTAHNVLAMTGRPVTGACLVGAIVQAGGGLSQTQSQPVQRALDLTWHTLYGDEDERVRWCPAPSIRASHVRELTRWNDESQRTVDQVEALLIDTVAAADREIHTQRSVEVTGLAGAEHQRPA